jgi:hypothetical protein
MAMACGMHHDQDACQCTVVTAQQAVRDVAIAIEIVRAVDVDIACIAS